MYAVQNGHCAVVQMLLSQSYCDLLAHDNVSCIILLTVTCSLCVNHRLLSLLPIQGFVDILWVGTISLLLLLLH